MTCCGLAMPFWSQISKAWVKKLWKPASPQNHVFLLQTKNSLDADRKDLNDTGGVMLRCFIKAAQLQCVAKHPTTVKLHPGLLQLRPHTESRSQNWHSQKNCSGKILHHIHNHIHCQVYEQSFETLLRMRRGTGCPQSAMSRNCKLGLFHCVQPTD